MSPSEDEEDECLRSRSGRSQLKPTEPGKPEKEEDATADDNGTTTVAAQAAPPSTTGGEPATPVMKRSSSGNRLQRKRPPRLTLDKSRLAKGVAEQDAGSFGDRLDFCKVNLFRGGEEAEEAVVVPQEKILRRLNSRMTMNSYQLGKQLSLRWTTGAGPRIGCVRDYPPELQFRVMEQISLTPRGGAGPLRLGSTATPRQSPCAPLPSPAPLYAAAGTPTSLLQHGAA